MTFEQQGQQQGDFQIKDEYKATNQATPWSQGAAPQDDGVLQWDSVISQESSFIDIPEGIYDATVTGVEQDYHNGSGKLPACPKAVVTVRIMVNGQEAEVRDNFYLHNSTEWKISQFFLAVGMKKHGEDFRMNWQGAIGKTCRIQVKKNQYQGKTYTNIDRWIDPATLSKPPYQQGQFKAQ